MELPDYWIERPGGAPDDSARQAFDALWDATLTGDGCPRIDYDLAWPKWQFVCHLGDRHRLAFHGSPLPDIAEFEPRKPHDVSEFGSRLAVYAASDALWAMFFAVVDRDRVGSIANACVRVEDETGAEHGPLYVFSVTRTALPEQPWRSGTLYVLPRHGFEQQPSMTYGSATVHLEQLASPDAVRPLAKISVDPVDFPFLGDVRGHDDSQLSALAEMLATGGPWPEP